MSSSDSKGLWWQKFFPVEGDTAFAELWAGKQMWADVHLEGLRLDQVGEARIEGARQVLTLFPPKWPSEFTRKGAWALDAVEVSAQLEQARAWLLENERGREPEQSA